MDLSLNKEDKSSVQETGSEKIKLTPKRDWETPKLEDVSGQVMAQPYIRFT